MIKRFALQAKMATLGTGGKPVRIGGGVESDGKALGKRWKSACLSAKRQRSKMARNPHGFAVDTGQWGVYAMMPSLRVSVQKKGRVGERERVRERKRQQKQQEIFKGKQKMFLYRLGHFRAMAREVVGAGVWIGRDLDLQALQVRPS